MKISIEKRTLRADGTRSLSLVYDHGDDETSYDFPITGSEATFASRGNFTLRTPGESVAGVGKEHSVEWLLEIVALVFKPINN